MRPVDFLKTIYLGDRGCKGILIDGFNDSVSLHATVISRVRSTDGRWDYYTAEDIVDGRLVFTGVSSFSMTPPGPIPNDFINEITVRDERDPNSINPRYVFSISLSAIDENGSWSEVFVEVVADGIHLEDPARPGVVIYK